MRRNTPIEAGPTKSLKGSRRADQEVQQARCAVALHTDEVPYDDRRAAERRATRQVAGEWSPAGEERWLTR
jgi:hypothetical protein